MATQSKHFIPQRLTQGVFAAIAADGGAAISNSGLIDLGEQLVVFDTFLTPQAAQDWRQFAVETFNRPPTIIVNSHYHNDHIWGNQVFAADAHIISSSPTRALITTAGAEEYQWYSENSGQRLAALRQQYETATQEERQNILLWLGYYEGLVEALPHLTVCLPNLTFDNRLALYGTQGQAELITFSGAHTKHDGILYLPQEGIVLMSDLLFVGCHPYLADGDPYLLLQALREISGLNATQFVPGHGPVGNRADLEKLIEYIEGCLLTAQGLTDGGETSQAQIKAQPIPAQYKTWQLPHFYSANLQFLCERLAMSRAAA